MNYSEFIRRAANNLPLPVLNVPKGRTEGYRKFDETEHEPLYPAPRQPLGYDYAVKYRVQDEQELEQEGCSNLDEIEGMTSVAGTLPNLDDIKDQLTQVYDIYSFDKKTVNNLLVHSYKEEILENIESNSVVIIKGQTGCGKTTQVPQFILDNAASANIHCNIVVTQPRKIATISVAERVAKERGWQVGTIVGYQISLEKKVTSDTRLVYCTTGVLLQQLIKAKSLDNYTHIIVDEVHERDQETDFLLILLKIFLRSSGCRTKIILMSATISTEMFSEYFRKKVKGVVIEPPVIHLRQEIKYPVTVFYLDNLVSAKMPMKIPDTHIDKPNIELEAYRLACSLVEVFHNIDKREHDDNFLGSVLIFLPGLHEIEKLYEMLQEREKVVDSSGEKWWLCPLHSSVTFEEQRRVFQPAPPNHRKVILATNIAESSITVPDVKYVLDFCLMKYQMQEADTSYTSLQLGWMSKSQAAQRAGRVGRVMPGRVYRLVQEATYKRFEENSCPEMLRCSLDYLVLKAKELESSKPPAQILAWALDPPDLSNILRTIVNLKEVGALMVTSDGVYKEDDGDLTFIGHVMASLPLDIHLTKLIIIGHMFSLLKETIIMACAMAVRSIFSTPFKQQLDAYNSKIAWSDSSCSDPFSFLYAYNVWERKSLDGYLKRNSGAREKELAERYFIQLKAMKEVKQLEEKVTLRLRHLNIEEPINNKVTWKPIEQSLILKVIIAGAFYPNYFVRCQVDEKEAVKTLGGRDPFTTVYLTNMPMDQPGPLYANKIKQYFAHCGSDCNISFDGSSKVYLTFENSSLASDLNSDKPARMPGSIQMAVYRAIKLRQLGKSIILPLLPLNKAREKAQQIFGDSSLPLHFQRLNKSDHNSLPKSHLPGVSIEIIQVYITHIESPSKFWIKIKDENFERRFFWLNNLLNSEDIVQGLLPVRSKLTIGMLVAAPFYEGESQEKYFYRAKIRNIGPRNSLQVFFIDFGNTEWVDRDEVREFGPNLIEKGVRDEPEIAMQCTLTEIQPTQLNCNGVWSRKAIEEFKSHFQNYAIAKIFSVVNGIISVVLFHPLNVTTAQGFPFEKSFNYHLINKCYAERCDEPYLSRENRLKRDTASKRPELALPPFSSLSSAEPSTCNIDPPKDHECTHKVILKGPRSPLEMKLYCLTKKCQGKEVNIEWNSVNSVLLDTYPMDPHERLMVAAVVTQNPTGERLTLRNTTMMPNIHGLFATMSLIFAPQSELRANPDRTRLTGALCGLGYDPLTKKPYNPENDMEINFDTEFTLDDLEKINQLRYHMNQVVFGGKDWNKRRHTDDVIMGQHKIKELILKIVQRKRPSIGVQNCSTFKWGQIDEDYLLCPTTNDIEEVSIYPLIWGIELEDCLPVAQIESSLQKLEFLASGREAMRSSVTCELCQIGLDDIPSVKLHLNTALHRETLTRFKSNYRS